MSNLDDVKTAFIDSFISPVKGAIEYRAKNNFFGSLAISWTIWNWEKIAYFLYSDDGVITKINNITSTDFLVHHIPWPQWVNYILKSSVYPPLIFAILFTLLHPMFTWGLSRAHKKIMNSIYDFNVDVENSRQAQKELILRNALELESIKNIKQSETDRTIAENNAIKAKSERDIENLIKEYATKEAQLKGMESQTHALVATLAQQNIEKINLTNELQELMTEVYPYRQDKGKIDDLHHQISELREKNLNLNSVIDDNNDTISRNERHISALNSDINDVISNRKAILERVEMSHKHLLDAMKTLKENGFSDPFILENINSAIELIDTKSYSVYTPPR
ncbi:TPA: hypothetical protein RRG90_004657 [Klebsiella pneumoniae]|uniref:hypothetical protein n=1 Tax=Klebsiella pneumoniae TaxID=573 RepID=UPI000DE6E97E|nr:hypothetical protein [Klebsiella pneumoniae]SSG85613.1 Uncharacterised protein [Klebsiella pneumoniae]HBU9134798.1 hypothetical protein [Klebsiella pneumoniae]HCB1353895.1 hypothetical protein [Klebsiella pneumoniae]HDY8355807.1 hypothetical protein [Klebsiella pneumoniae]